MPDIRITRKDFLDDRQGRTFADVLNDAEQPFDHVLEFFNDKERQTTPGGLGNPPRPSGTGRCCPRTRVARIGGSIPGTATSETDEASAAGGGRARADDHGGARMAQDGPQGLARRSSQDFRSHEPPGELPQYGRPRVLVFAGRTLRTSERNALPIGSTAPPRPR